MASGEIDDAEPGVRQANAFFGMDSDVVWATVSNRLDHAIEELGLWTTTMEVPDTCDAAHVYASAGCKSQNRIHHSPSNLDRNASPRWIAFINLSLRD